MKKRRIPNLFVRWIKFHLFEGISKEKVVPMRHWIHTLRQVFFLLKTDVLKEMCKIPRTDMTVIRGSQDRFFCDDKDVELLVGNGFDVIEVDAGHDWNKNVADTAEKIMSR